MTSKGTVGITPLKHKLLYHDFQPMTLSQTIKRIGSPIFLSTIAFFLVCLSEAATATRPSRHYAHMSVERRMFLLRQAHNPNFPLSVRLNKATWGVLGAPYLVSPLGEARGIDPDPRFRLDAFDCTTFVETAIALCQSPDWSVAADVLDKLRYRGEKRTFNERRHFIAASWLAGLQKDGYLKDITTSIGGPATKTITLKLNSRRWKKRRIARDLKLPPDKIPFGTHQLEVIPIEAFKKNSFNIPSGTLINVVRNPVAWAPIIVTHQGLYFVDKNGGAWVRHASPVAKRVIDEPFTNMLRRYRKPRKWPMAGFNFQAIQVPKTRQASSD
jgi:hypothetical protein